ncbi:MAG: XdhC/CoxI family protein [Desulfobacterales bacterium]|jgi:xanthine dehydrogenase accessory factor
MDIHARIVELLEKEENVCLATVLESNRSDICPGQKAIVRPNKPMEGSLGSSQSDASAVRLAQQALKKNKSVVVEIEPGCSVFLNVLSVDAQLVICGAGHIALPLAQFSQKLGFQVTVIDDRPDFASPARFPGCNIIAEDFTAALRGMTFGPAAYVVVITRGHEHDVDCLIEIIDKETVYVGLIGSRRRVRFVLEALAQKGLPRERLDDVFTPIGLPIGAESPEEIAVSIVSELVCVRRKGPAQARTLRKAVGIE